jgi:hypothetical protein
MNGLLMALNPKKYPIINISSMVLSMVSSQPSASSASSAPYTNSSPGDHSQRERWPLSIHGGAGAELALR